MRTTFIMTAVLSIFLGTLAQGREFHVSPEGNDSNPGTVAKPFRTIMAAIKQSKAGDAILLKQGTYREELVFGSQVKGEKGKPISLMPEQGNEIFIKGSDVVTGWVKYKNDIWMKKEWKHNSQQVFSNGAILKQIGFQSKAYPPAASDGNWMIRRVGSGTGDMIENSFYCDIDKKTLYVWLKDGKNPNETLMEASVRMYLINALSSQYITVNGVKFRHSNTSAFKQGGAALEMGDFCVIENCDVQWCDFAGISPGYKHQGTKIINCVVSNNGNTGIGPCAHENYLIEDCKIEYNNYRRFNQHWHAGGIKISPKTSGIIRNCYIANNFSSGVWYDSCMTGKQVVESCVIYNNATQGGIMVEHCDGITVKNNLIVNNDQFGIHYVVSSNGAIIGNTIMEQRDFIALDVSGPRNNSEHGLENNIIKYNTVIDSKCRYDLHMIKPDGKYVRNNICDNNVYIRSGGPKLRYNAGGRKDWKDLLITGDLKRWRKETGFDMHSVVVDSGKTSEMDVRTK